MNITKLLPNNLTNYVHKKKSALSFIVTEDSADILGVRFYFAGQES